jgi:hypothetical protein
MLGFLRQHLPQVDVPALGESSLNFFHFEKWVE